MFRRILVANRGEIALRVIRACREMGIESVAVYSTADEESLHVRDADHAVRIGPPDARRSYLSQPNLIMAAKSTGCEAIHPGYGFLSENPEFARLCSEQELSFIGPSPDTMDRLGDKSAAKQVFAQAGLPTVPGSAGPVSSEAEALAVAADIGYPVLLKAAAGGGGRGMRRVEHASELGRSFAGAAAEAEAAFGNGDLYVEKVILEPHHIEVQIVADRAGNVVTLGERDCSIQRRHQKLLEESPSPLLDEDTREWLENVVAEAVAAIGYEGAGTLEFLADNDRNLYFMEMNTRVQVEHPVSEMVTGVDIIREQIAVAAGGSLSVVGRAARVGHAIELRICAEDAGKGFRPSGGVVERLRLPAGPGIRVDTHLYEGYRVPTHYDSLVAKIIAWDTDRPRCVDRCLRALYEFELEGLPTTADVLGDVLRDGDFRSGVFSTAFLEEKRSALGSLRVGAEG